MFFEMLIRMLRTEVLPTQLNPMLWAGMEFDLDAADAKAFIEMGAAYEVRPSMKPGMGLTENKAVKAKGGRRAGHQAKNRAQR